jgi:hypothetical protein
VAREGQRCREPDRLSLHLRLCLCCLCLCCLCLCVLRRGRRRRGGRRRGRVVASGGRRRLQTVALGRQKQGHASQSNAQSADRCASSTPVRTAPLRAHVSPTHLLARSGGVDFAAVEARIPAGAAAAATHHGPGTRQSFSRLPSRTLARWLSTAFVHLDRADH